jgi:hypothetical protein
MGERMTFDGTLVLDVREANEHFRESEENTFKNFVRVDPESLSIMVED